MEDEIIIPANIPYHIPQIALWGPQSSGKSWLLFAFQRRVRMIDEYLKRGLINQDFRISLSARDIDVKDDDLSQPPPATQEIITKRILFQRNMIPSKSSVRMSLQHRVNTHSHEIKVMDNQGQMLVPDISLKQKNGNSEEHANLQKSDDDAMKRVEAALDFVVRSQNIIVVLDSKEEKENSKFKISEKIKKFLDDNVLRSGRKYNIAFCLTKVDALGELDIQGSSDDAVQSFLIRQLGSREQEKILGLVQELQQDGHEARLFATSACGYIYIQDTRKRVPNLKFSGDNNNNNSSIMDPEGWKPEGVEKPFFWLLEKIEKNRISQIEQNGNGYEKVLWKSPMKADRMGHYLSYESILHYADMGERKSN